MAVLIEAISVVIKGSAIEDKFPGGEQAFLDTVPNQTLCSDTELVRVGFMTPDDVGAYIDLLEENGLTHIIDGEAADLVVIDQQRGPTSSCSWVEAGRVPWDKKKKQFVTVCRLKNSKVDVLMHPDDWTYEDSLSCTYGFVPSEYVDRSLEFLRKEGNMDVYLNTVTGKEVYVGRTSDKEMEKGK